MYSNPQGFLKPNIDRFTKMFKQNKQNIKVKSYILPVFVQGTQPYSYILVASPGTEGKFA